MASPHPGMHVLCPVCEGPIPDLLGELTDEPAAINSGTRATDCYYCEAALLYIEQALQDEANNPHRDPNLPPITKTKMVNRFGQRAFEAYTWT